MITKVSDDLYRGPLIDDPKPLRDLGIKTIIWLESGLRDQFYPNREYTWDFLFLQISCSDIFPPTDQAVDRFLRDVGFEPPTYVHCQRGKDRTGYMVAAYRMQRQYWSYKDAVKEMYDMGFNRWLYWWWVFRLKKYEG